MIHFVAVVAAAVEDTVVVAESNLAFLKGCSMRSVAVDTAAVAEIVAGKQQG